MDLKTEDLRTFLCVYEEGTFSKASTKLSLTQSALSQKIARLEEALSTTLFIRYPRHLELTPSGEKLFIFAKDILQQQDEFFKGFNQYSSQLAGHIRIASYSSVHRSLIIPAFQELLLKHSDIDIQFSSHEMYELEGVLKTNKAEFIITDYWPQLSQIEQVQINEEEYVEITSKTEDRFPNIYLDHGTNDNATESFFAYQGQRKKYQRRFLGDVYSIIDGVDLGLGRAIMSKHLIDKDKRFKMIKSKRRYKRPIVLSWVKKNYYGNLHHKVIEILSSLTS